MNKYSHTLNLPQTPFPMRARLGVSEPQSWDRWSRDGLHRLTPPQGFLLHDGPPYANGPIHLGHLLNKTLKDFVVRDRSMRGVPSCLMPGWDCHGLPIEHRVLKQQGPLQGLELRRACARYAQGQKQNQDEQMRRLLLKADFSSAYTTMSPSYERATLELFALLVERGLVERKARPVYWSVDHQTALAEAELLYKPKRSKAAYVRLQTSRTALEERFGDLPTFPEGQGLLVWTTTPWSLPANLAVAVAPDLPYVLAHWRGQGLVVGRDRLEVLPGAQVLAELKGAQLAGLSYTPPLGMERAPGAHSVLVAEHVQSTEGSGLVHIAPGHGLEDFHAAPHLPVYCPVGPDGRFVDDPRLPRWLVGRSALDSSEDLLEALRASGSLVRSHHHEHSYPHDWRSGGPVLQRATAQWFLVMDRALPEGATLREASLQALDSVDFHPPRAKRRLRAMLERRPDWCLSRQRAWGLPLPAFFDAQGHPWMPPEAVRSVAEAFGEHGSDLWFQATPKELLGDLHPAGAQLQKGADVFDVWFEAGASWWAVASAKLGRPQADLYLEGSDQHRGWFQASLLLSVAAGFKAPFRAVMTHGFVLDGDGFKMSKSLGNTLSVAELLKTYGADVLRLWVATVDPTGDVRADHARLKDASQQYRKLRNTLRFLLGACGSPSARPHCAPETLEAWVLSTFDRMVSQFLQAMEALDFQRALRTVSLFCSQTLSSQYLPAVKDRLYCDPPQSERRLRAQSALYEMAEGLVRLLAPLLPHTADEAWRSLHQARAEDARSVHSLNYPQPAKRTAPSPAWRAALVVRERALLALEGHRSEGGATKPLDTKLILPDPQGALASLSLGDLADFMGVSEVEMTPSDEAVRVVDLRSRPMCERSRRRDPTVKRRACGALLSDRDARALNKLL